MHDRYPYSLCNLNLKMLVMSETADKSICMHLEVSKMVKKTQKKPKRFNTLRGSQYAGTAMDQPVKDEETGLDI